MAKRRKNKSSANNMLSGAFESLNGVLTQQWASVVISVIIFIFAGYMFVSARNAPYFNINRIEVHEDNTQRSFSLEGDPAIGSSVFKVDLKDIHRRIKTQFPEYKNIQVSRRPPDKIVASVNRQLPVAQFKSGRFFSISKEGLLLPEVTNLPMSSLPIIVDENRKIKDEQIGTNVMYENMDIAFRLIDNIKKLNLPDDFQIYEIDITDKNNLYLYQKGGIEIRIGAPPFDKKLWLLESAFKSFDIDPAKIKYIDLRFEDVVIGPK